MEHDDTKATFVGFDISIDKGKFIYKMFYKRDTINFYIVRMPSIRNNIPYIIFYSSTMSEFAAIPKSTLLLKEFLLVAKNLLDWVINQADSKYLLLKQIKKTFYRHPEAFQKYYVIASNVVSKIAVT